MSAQLSRIPFHWANFTKWTD